MPEFFLELFSEEIPARMQARAADDLSRLVAEALSPLAPTELRPFYASRRIALAATVAPGVAASRAVERGPRRTAPEQALAGFLRKHAAARGELREEGEFWVLDRATPGIAAAALIASELPSLLRRFPWPKSMRWGGTSGFTWVRPLRRIVCLLDGEVVPFDLRDGADDGHGLAASSLSEGHRFLSPGTFAVTGCAGWIAELRARHVIVDQAERRALVADGVDALATAHRLTVADDPGLIDEVAGLVEWPVSLLGRIDAAHMDLPPEVMQVSMRVNQRYFALRDAAGRAAPCFAFVANIAAPDEGRTIVAGNERVLRARFSDARHFWDLDRRRTLASRVAASGCGHLPRQARQPGRARPPPGRPRPQPHRPDGRRRRGAGRPRRTAGQSRPHHRHGRASSPNSRAPWAATTRCTTAKPEPVADAMRDHYAPKGPSDAPCRRIPSPSPSHSPTRSTSSPRSSASARSPAAPAIPMRCAAPHSG